MNWKWPSIWSDERGGWWRVPVVWFLFHEFFGFLGILVAMALERWGIQDVVKNGSDSLKVGTKLFLTYAPSFFGGIGFLLGLKLIHRKPISCVITDGRPFRFGLFVQSSVVWALLWLPGVILFPGGLYELTRRLHEMQSLSWFGICLVAFSAMTIMAAFEEILYRGYLQTRLAAALKRPWLAICLSTIVFTLMHNGEMTTAARVRVVAVGIATGVALMRANSLAPLIGMHATSNALYSIFLPSWSNANTNLLDVVFWVIQLSIWLKWLFWVTKKDSQSAKVLTVPSMGT